MVTKYNGVKISIQNRLNSIKNRGEIANSVKLKVYYDTETLTIQFCLW